MDDMKEFEEWKKTRGQAPKPVDEGSRYHISILRIKPDNSPGIQFQITVKSTGYRQALKDADPLLVQELKESGLSET